MKIFCIDVQNMDWSLTERWRSSPSDPFSSARLSCGELGFSLWLLITALSARVSRHSDTCSWSWQMAAVCWSWSWSLGVCWSWSWPMAPCSRSGQIAMCWSLTWLIVAWSSWSRSLMAWLGWLTPSGTSEGLIAGLRLTTETKTVTIRSWLYFSLVT